MLFTFRGVGPKACIRRRNIFRHPPPSQKNSFAGQKIFGPTPQKWAASEILKYIGEKSEILGLNIWKNCFSYYGALKWAPPPRKRRENLKQPFLGHFWSKWAGFLHETLLSHTLSGKLVNSHPQSTRPPAPPPVRAAARPTAFRQKLSNPADIRRDNY